MLGHFISMKKNIPVRPSIGVIGLHNHYIPFVHFDSPSPTVVMRTFEESFFTFFRAKMSFVFFDSGRPMPRFFTAISAFCSNPFLACCLVALARAKSFSFNVARKTTHRLSTLFTFFKLFIHDAYCTLFLGKGQDEEKRHWWDSDKKDSHKA